MEINKLNKLNKPNKPNNIVGIKRKRDDDNKVVEPSQNNQGYKVVEPSLESSSQKRKFNLHQKQDEPKQDVPPSIPLLSHTNNLSSTTGYDSNKMDTSDNFTNTTNLQKPSKTKRLNPYQEGIRLEQLKEEALNRFTKTENHFYGQQNYLTNHIKKTQSFQNKNQNEYQYSVPLDTLKLLPNWLQKVGGCPIVLDQNNNITHIKIGEILFRELESFIDKNKMKQDTIQKNTQKQGEYVNKKMVKYSRQLQEIHNLSPDMLKSKHFEHELNCLAQALNGKREDYEKQYLQEKYPPLKKRVGQYSENQSQQGQGDNKNPPPPVKEDKELGL